MDFFDLFIQLIHILIFGLFLIYIGIVIPEQDWIYWIAFSIGLFLPIYWIATFHKQDIFWIIWHCLVAIFLLWIGIQKHDSPDFIFRVILMLGILAIGYHFTRMVQMIFTDKKKDKDDEGE